MPSLQSIDELAAVRGTETLYLHVDVANYRAISVYETAGYRAVPQDDPLYHEFTKSLNLHEGATKGRNHYVMHKHLQDPTWLRVDNKEKAVLGFEVVA